MVPLLPLKRVLKVGRAYATARTALLGLLALLLLAPAICGCNWFRKEDDLAGKDTDVTRQNTGPVPPGGTEAVGGPILPGMHECLTTEHGLRRKVVITQPGTRCQKTPGGELLGSENALRLFQELFVLAAGPDQQVPEWYLVSKSPRRHDQLGYLAADVVAEWPTRIGLRPLKTVLLYQGPQGAEELARTGQTSQSPMARADGDHARAFLPWPVVQTRTVKNGQGNVVEIAQIHVLGELDARDRGAAATADGTSYSEQEKDAIAAATSILTVAFCSDNTNSTGPFVPGIITFIKGTTDEISRLRPNLRLALTLYRDDVPQLRWGTSVTKTFWDGAPQECTAFLKEVTGIEAPNIGSMDWPECGYQGLWDTLHKTKWHPLSHKTLIWIGDNSSHPPGSPRNPDVSAEQIVALAKQQGVTIHAVCIQGEGGDDEQALHLKQCETIAHATGGEVYQLSDYQAIANQITKAVAREKEELDKNQRDIERVRSGELTIAELKASEDREELNRRYKFVRLLENAGVDLTRLGPGVPTFAQGWVATQLPDGEPLFERMVYISQVELSVLLAELNHLIAVLDIDPSRGVLEVFRVAIAPRVGEQSFFSLKRAGDIPLDAFLAARGIPLRSGISLKTRAELLAMSEEERWLLKQRLVNEVIPRLSNARSSTAFKTVGGFDFGWIPEALLP